MNEIFSRLQNPSWWFDLVVVAFVVGIAASYGRNWIDRIRAALGLSVSQTRKDILHDLHTATDDQSYRIELRLRSISLRQRAQERLVVALLFLMYGVHLMDSGGRAGIIFVLGFACLGFSGLRCSMAAAGADVICDEIAKRKRKERDAAIKDAQPKVE